MKINTHEHTIVELLLTNGDVCFREKFFLHTLEQSRIEKETEHGQCVHIHTHS